MGAKPLFAPPIIRREFCNFVYLKKINMKESRNRDNNTKKTEYILNERCTFCKKKLSMTKKKVVRNFGENRRELFKIFCLKINLPKSFPPNICDLNFCPPIFVTQIFAPSIFMTSLRRCLAPSLGGQKIVRGPNFRMTFLGKKFRFNAQNF